MYMYILTCTGMQVIPRMYVLIDTKVHLLNTIVSSYVLNSML